MSAFVLGKAVRDQTKALIAIYGESGRGKTYGSLLLARGLVGPQGRIAMIDTETGRGALYADVIPGGYEYVELAEPFSPMRYVQAINDVEKQGVDAIVIDSVSHEWDGVPGGVLDMADKERAASGRDGIHNWIRPKAAHKTFMQRLLRARTHVIVCVRAHHGTTVGKDANGKTTVTRDAFTTPVQERMFIFEMLVHGEVLLDHSFQAVKVSHPDLEPIFPLAPITIATGEKLAVWCTGVRAPKPHPGWIIRTADEASRSSVDLEYPDAAGWIDGWRSTIEANATNLKMLDWHWRANKPQFEALAPAPEVETVSGLLQDAMLAAEETDNG